MLEDLRRLIAEAARDTPGVGALEESVKWGEQSFAPAKSRIGSSVRLQPRATGDVALMFICHTHLIDEFRRLYGGELAFEGDRAIVVDSNKPMPAAALKHCIALALTYHLRKRGGITCRAGKGALV